jgi:integrase
VESKVRPGHSRARIRQRRAPAAGRPALWEGRFTYHDPDASSGRRQLSVYGSSKAEAEAKLAEAMAALQKGVKPPRGGLTLEAYLDAWLAQVEPDLKLSTALRYRGLVERHMVPRLGKVRLTRLTPADVNGLTAKMISAGLTAATANHARAVLRTALNDAIRQGLVTRNAAALADPRRIDPKPIEPISPDEARAILEAFVGHIAEPVVATALWTGMRLGELLALTWDRVDIDGGSLRVAGSTAHLAGRTLMWGPKNRSSVRVVPIAAPLVPVLSAQRLRQRELRLAAGAAWDGSWGDLVFTNSIGNPLIGSTVTHQFKDRLRTAGLPVRRFHDLRHGAATLWLAAGVDLKTVSALLGHSNIATTANVYTGVLDSLRRDAVDRMANLLSPTTSTLLRPDSAASPRRRR